MIKNSRESKNYIQTRQRDVIKNFNKLYIELKKMPDNNAKLVDIICYDRQGRLLDKTYSVQVKVSKIRETALKVMGKVEFIVEVDNRIKIYIK